MRDIQAMGVKEFLEFFLQTLSEPKTTIERLSNE